MGKNYRHIYREKRSLISCEAHLNQYIDHRDIFGSIHKYAFLYAYDGVAEEFHREIDNKRWHELGKNILDKSFFKKLLNDGKIVREQLNSVILVLNTRDLKKLSDKELINLFIKAYQIYSRIRAFFRTSRPEFQSIAEFKLKKYLIEELKTPQEAQKVFEILTTPAEFDEINQEFIDWVNLVSRTTNIKQMILKHLYKYPWLVAQSYNHHEIINSFYKKYKENQKNLQTLKMKVKELIKIKRKLLSKQNELLTKFKNKDIKYLSWVFRESALERMRLKGGWAGADFLYYPLYIEISRRTMIELESIFSFYRLGDVIKSIKIHQPSISNFELKRRKKAFVLWLKNKKLAFFSGTRADKIIKQELRHIKKKIEAKGLTGQIASSGVATGRVCIIISGDILMLNNAITNFKEGDVIVSPMTQPNLVTLMKKASAIVTDEGGLISHAAIMAREFNIPCIVGTEIATKIFKDGDFVEVNANTGFVRKLK